MSLCTRHYSHPWAQLKPLAGLVSRAILLETETERGSEKPIQTGSREETTLGGKDRTPQRLGLGEHSKVSYRKISVVEEGSLSSVTGGDCGRGWVRKSAVQMWCLGPVAGPAGPLLLHCPKRVVSVTRLKGGDPP